VLVAIYGLGMAATLLAAGVLLVRVQTWLERNWFDQRWLRLTLRAAPILTATMLVIGGLSITVRGALSV
jgi:cytochrome c biogenesis protein CcdA